jgi:hypothetical protein
MGVMVAAPSDGRMESWPLLSSPLKHVGFDSLGDGDGVEQLGQFTIRRRDRIVSSEELMQEHW